MYAGSVRDQITRLRLKNGGSEYNMSYDLGHSRGYINNVSSGKALPSMAELFAICDRFDITPIEFFDQELSAPGLLSQTMELLVKLDAADLEPIHRNIRRLLRKNSY